MRSGRVRIDRVYGNEAAAAGGSATAAGPGASLTFLRRLETGRSEGEWAQHSVCRPRMPFTCPPLASLA